jgi:hypothetical protein
MPHRNKRRRARRVTRGASLAKRSLRCEGLEDRRLLSVSPVGNQFQVNTYVGGNQITPRIAMDSTGNYIAVWESTGEDGSQRGIYAMRFDAAGNPLLRNASAIAAPSGNPYEFRVNTFTTDDQWEPDIAVDSDGDFVITWTSLGQAAYNNFSVYAQRFNAAGAPQGSEFRVNNGTGTDQRASQVAMDPNGNFVVTWQSQSSGNYSIFARRYNAAGVAQGSQITVASGNILGPYYIGSHVALDATGDFVVAYNRAANSNIPSLDVRAKRYNSAGVLQGSEISVNTYTTNAQYAAFVGIDAAGNFTIIWESQGQDGSGYGIYGQRFTAAGATLGSEFRINGTTAGNQSLATMGMETDGDFTVTWMADGQDGSGYGIYARRFNAAGVAQGAEYLVNTTTAGNQIYPQIAINDTGNEVIVWANAVPTGVETDPWQGTGIFARRYQTNLAPVANAGGPYTIPVGSGVSLNATGSSDPESQPLTYSWDLDNNGVFGDVTGATPTVSAVTLATYGIVLPASYPIKVRVSDGYGGSTDASATLTVYVLNTPPTANAGGPYSILEGQGVTLNASASSDPDPLQTLTYAWDLNNDGNFTDAVGVNPTVSWSTLVSLGINDGTVTYNSVRVRVSDGDGGITTSSGVLLTVNNVAPTANAGGPYAINEGESLVLAGSGSDLAGAADPLTYSWDLNGDNVFGDATGAAPTVSWAQLVALGINDGPAAFNVQLRVDDGDGGVTTSTAVTLTVLNVAPTANAGGPYAVNEGGSLSLVGSASDPAGAADPLTYSWDVNGDNVFGDATGDSPTLTWSELLALGITPGNAVITNLRLQVDDGDGGITTSAPVILIIDNLPPVADAGGPYTIVEGASLNLSAAASSDPESQPLTYSWDINGDNVFGDATGVSPTLSWAQLNALGIVDGPSNFNVSVRVDDGIGGVTTSTAVVLTVDNAPPTADAGGPYTIQEGDSLVLAGTGSDPAGANDALTYSWDINGDSVFGDATGASPTLTWAQLNALGITDGPSAFNVQLRVDDGDGGITDSTVVLLTVNNAAPTADAGGPYTVTEGQSLTLNGSGTDPVGANDPLTYSWDLNGDNVFGDATGASPTLSWLDLVALGINDGPATFNNVRVRVSDGDGGITTSSAVTLSVVNAPPTANSGGPYTVIEGQSLTLNGSASDPGGAADPLNYSWDLNGDNVIDATIASPTFTWSQLVALGFGDGPTTYNNVRLQVGDGESGVALVVTSLTVVNAPPTADAGGPYTIVEGSSLNLNGTGSDPAGAADPLTYSWDINGDNVFGDATGASPTLSWAQLNALGITDGTGATYNVKLQVSDGDGGITQSNAVLLTVNNAAPAAGISGPATLARDASGNYTLTATDPAAADQAAGFTYTIDWNGDGSDVQVVNGLTGLVVAHTFTTVGARTIKVTATDDDGGVSSQSTLAVSVSAVQVVGGDLIWTGTAGDDSVSFEDLGGGQIRVTTTLENGLATNFVQTISGVTGIVKASGLAGNDTLDGSLMSTTSTRLDGGVGNNTLYGGGANDVLIGGGNVAPKHNGPEGQQGSNIIVGGAGDDTIYGNAINGAEGKGGNNILVGGDGNDTIYGNWTDGGEGGGRNIIVGGADADTLYDYKIADGAEGKGSILIADEISLSIANLTQVMLEWSSTHTYTDRVNNILGPGSIGRLNGSAYLQPGTTVTSDAAVDQLWGTTTGAAFNWFLYTATATIDEINRAKAGETQTTL